MRIKRVAVVRRETQSRTVLTRSEGPPRLFEARRSPARVASSRMGLTMGLGGQPRFAGDGPPPVTLIGAIPKDQYLDRQTGDIYELQ